MLKYATKLAVFPYQKGAYYCSLSQINLLNKNYKDIEQNYTNAYKYLKSYDYPCWNLAFFYYKSIGQYDTAINIALGHQKAYKNDTTHQNIINNILSSLYIMKQDYAMALEYANLSLKNEKISHYNYAKRGFIYRQLHQYDLAQKDLEKALSLCKNKNERKIIKNTYRNFRNIELKRELDFQKKVKNS